MPSQQILALSSPQYSLELAGKLPEKIRLGGSSWTYPGWKGLVYFADYSSERSFKHRSLAEYVRFPWFRTVGLDSAFYLPPPVKRLREYASQVPESFQWVSKVWERITVPRFPGLPRYGKWAGRENPDFLNADLFAVRVLEPYVESDLQHHCGPLVFQFPTIAPAVLEGVRFLEKLDAFLTKLPAGFRYAVELRNPEWLTQPYFDLLNRQRTAHCFNHWSGMPSLREQMQLAAAAGGLQAQFFVARLLTPLGVDYAAAVERFQPYDRIKEPNAEARSDAVRLARRALERNIDAFIVVNNRLEGHSPGTVAAIGAMLVNSAVL